MILNEREYRGTLKKIKELEETISLHEKSPDKDVFSPAKEFGLQSFLEDLKHEVKEYEDIKQGIIPSHLYNFDKIGYLLIALRIKNGLTQQELANKLEIHQSQIARYERNDYFGITKPMLDKILDALNVQVKLTLIEKCYD